nr:uncharacterized protein LOC109174690 isoform X1 [Ipomoea trifida]
MQAVPIWQKVSILKKLIFQSTKIAAVTEPPATHFAFFHSTPLSLEKWKNKWKSDFRSQQASKNYIRYVTRQKRADSKKALKNLLFYGGSFDNSFEEKSPRENLGWDVEPDEHLDKKCKLKTSARSRTRIRRRQRKLKNQWLDEEDWNEHPAKIFQATFGDKWYTWSHKPRKEYSFDGSKAQFHHGEETEWSGRQYNWDNGSDTKYNTESCIVGSYSERSILGLPIRGPLKIEDVKNAFRLSALKWHPDKHQGPSQAAAEEKFKCCAAAYKSLCSALSPA